MKKLCLAALLAALQTGVSFAASPKIQTSFDLRLRYEPFDTVARTAALDRGYALSMGRARFGLDATWEHWKLHGLLQAAGILDVPDNAAFAAGTNYFSANGGDSSPSQIGLAELSAAYTHGGFKMVLGRQAYVDGNEVATGVGHLDAIKKRLLSDRLIGVFEWPNVGRRFDGASFGYGRGGVHLAGFGLQPLHGAFDHEDAFEPIDDVAVFGGTVTGKYGAFLPRSEVRLFAVQYEDSRDVARRTAGGDLSISTVGTSLLYGGDAGHVLLWGAVQGGDWGSADQQSWAYVVNAGRNFPALPGKPMVHLGLEQGSGDAGAGGDHETFFNILPTNHKFYGVMDYVDIPNLRDLYLETVLSPTDKLKVRAAVHDFALSERTDAWYGGSGAFEEESFGFASRLPGGGVYPAKDLGREADLEFTWTLPKGVQLGVGAGHFWGGEAAEAFVSFDSDGSWGYVELNWKR